MRRLTTTLGSLAATALLVLAVPQSALAATGELVVNGVSYQDPSGCIDSDRWPLAVDNRTDEPVFVFSEQGCAGVPIAVVLPGETLTSEFGASVNVR